MNTLQPQRKDVKAWKAQGQQQNAGIEKSKTCLQLDNFIGEMRDSRNWNAQTNCPDPNEHQILPKEAAAISTLLMLQKDQGPRKRATHLMHNHHYGPSFLSHHPQSTKNMSSHHKNKGSPGGSNHYQSQPRLLPRSLNRPTADQAIEHTVVPDDITKLKRKMRKISMSQEEQSKIIYS